MTSFTRLKAYPELQKLARNPIDLTAHLTPKRIETMSKDALGFSLFYGTERVTEEVLSQLLQLAEEAGALEKMAAMQKGEIVNKIDGYPCENRPALHTAMRDFFEDKNQAAAAKDAAKKGAKELHKLEEFLNKTDGLFTDVIQIGIGGSDLGPRALALALEPFYKKDRRAHFISNVDPDDVASVLEKVDLQKTLVIVVSKSGTTLETLTNETFVRQKMVEGGIDPLHHFVAVTGENSPMDNQNRYLESFYIWDFIGGRYSATSMVGAVLLGFLLGMRELKELLRGAHEMDLHALRSKPEANLPLLSALLGIWNRNFLGYPTVAIIPYSQALHRFPAHLQQLDMESNGKRVDKSGRHVDFSTGPVIWGEPGTNGQHSFYQLIHQGTDTVPVEFIGFRQSQYAIDLDISGSTSQEKLLANLFAQSIALAIGKKGENPNQVFPGNRPNRILFAKELTPYTLGALLSYYENKVAFQGFIWNINSFDQEGVQLGKVLATKMLAMFRGKETFALGEAFWKKVR